MERLDLLYSVLIDSAIVVLAIWTGVLLAAVIVLLAPVRKTGFLPLKQPLQPVPMPQDLSFHPKSS